MKKVAVILKSTEEVIFTYQVNLAGLNFNPDQNDCLQMAWDCAVEDKLVEADKKDEYLLQFVE
jgi:hypothetical protein